MPQKLFMYFVPTSRNCMVLKVPGWFRNPANQTSVFILLKGHSCVFHLCCRVYCVGTAGVKIGTHKVKLPVSL